MDKDLQAMWGFLSVGLFVLISAIMLDIAGLIANQPQTFFVIGTAFAVAFSCAMFVAAFIAGVDYIEHRMRKL